MAIFLDAGRTFVGNATSPSRHFVVPAHTVPLFHPKNTIVTIHGLEYEFCPQAYSAFARFYMRLTIKKSCQWARKIIAVSENTKQDLMRLYKVPAEKIAVVYEGYESSNHLNIKTFKHDTACEFLSLRGCNQTGNSRALLCPSFSTPPRADRDDQKCSMLHDLCSMPFLLFLGRIEERKNIGKIVEAFEILKEKYAIEHKLVLAGKPGFGFEKIQNKIQTSRYNNQIILTGFISEQEKWELLKDAEVFVFPTQYEGFGIPILEAQSVGCPVVASNNSSIIEVVACHSGLDPESSSRAQILKQVQDDKSLGNTRSALLVDPNSATEIAEAVWKIISDEKLKKDLIKKGLENVQRFSWEKCGREVGEILMM